MEAKKQMLNMVFDIVQPLSPIVAQALWVAQPTLSVFTDAQRIGEWARLLETPEGVTELREQLLGDHPHE